MFSYQAIQPQSHALGRVRKETILFTLFGSTSIEALNEIWELFSAQEWVSYESATIEVMVP